MTSPEGPTRRLCEGLAAHIGAVTTASWVPPPGVYTDDQTAIFVGRRPPSPARLITITPYLTGHLTRVDTVGIQLWFRALPGDVYDLADEIDNAVNGLARITLGGIRVAQITRRSGDDLAADQGVVNGLGNRVHNYYAAANRSWPNYSD